MKRQVFIAFISIILSSLLPIASSHSLQETCSNKGITSQAKIVNENILGNFNGGTFSFLNIKENLYLVTSERSTGGAFRLLNTSTGEIVPVTLGLTGIRDIFKVIKAPNFSASNPEIYFSAVAWGDLSTPRIGRQASEPSMKSTLPSGLVVYRGFLNLQFNKIDNIKIIYKQLNFVVSKGNFGGALALSKDSRYLYISVGDEDDYDRVQKIDSEVGKILRLYPDGGIPKDNPYPSSKSTSNVFAYGFRNTYGIVNLPSGELIAIDHGPLGGDELNIIRKSANYGWPMSSEGVHYSGEFIPSALIKMVRPVLTWTDAVAPSAIMILPDNVFPGLGGDILVSTLKGKSIFRIHKYCGGTFKIVEKIAFDFRIRDFTVTENGQLITLSDGNPSKLSMWSIKY
jgi:hypothetical protein